MIELSKIEKIATTALQSKSEVDSNFEYIDELETALYDILSYIKQA